MQLNLEFEHREINEVVAQHDFLKEVEEELIKLEGVSIDPIEEDQEGAQADLVTVALVIKITAASLVIVRQVYGIINDVMERRQANKKAPPSTPRLKAPNSKPLAFPAELKSREAQISKLELEE
jgi:hypothetical protein